MVRFFKESSKVYKTPREQLDLYKTCCQKFREACKEVLPKDVFGSGTASLPYQIPVHPAQIQQLIDFYKTIMQKREYRLSTEKDERKAFARRYKEKNKGKETYTVSHYSEFYDFLCGREHTGSISLSARARSGTGKFDHGIGPSPGTENNTVDKTGYLLLSTALEQHIRITKTTLNDYITKNVDDAIGRLQLKKSKTCMKHRGNKKKEDNNGIKNKFISSNVQTLTLFLISFSSLMLLDTPNPTSVSKI